MNRVLQEQNVWPAPGKLNLFLHITGQRKDGYHLLQTVFQFIELADEIQIKVKSDSQIEILHRVPGIQVENDLTFRAAKILQQETACGLGAAIRLTKHLPIGGGIGGGSSDAATVLLALNRLWKTGLSVEDLAVIGLQLGADVPVFIHGHACWAEGVGEIIREIDVPEPVYLLIDPKIHVSTAEVFKDSQLTRNTQPIRIADFLDGKARNDCESVVRTRYPVVDQVMSWLDNYSMARLTGTGACVFAVFEDEPAAEAVSAKCPVDWQSYVVRGVNRSPLHSLFEQLDAIK